MMVRAGRGRIAVATMMMMVMMMKESRKRVVPPCAPPLPARRIWACALSESVLASSRVD